MDLKKFWDKMRLWIIYGILIVVLLFEAIGVFFPSVLNIIDRRGYIIISIAFVGIFIEIEQSIKATNNAILKEIECSMETTNKATLETTKGFISELNKANILNFGLKGPFDFNLGLTEVLDKAIERDSKITGIDIFAETANTYYEFISCSRYKIENINILVANMDILKKHQIPLSPNNYNNWQGLKEDHHEVKKFDIKTFDFLATFFFAIINKKYAHLGIYKILPNSPGYAINRETYIITDNDPVSTALLSNLQFFFTNIYGSTKLSKEIGDSKI